MDVHEIRKMMVEHDYRNCEGFYESDTKCGYLVLFELVRESFSITLMFRWVGDDIQMNYKITAIFYATLEGDLKLGEEFPLSNSDFF